MALLASVLEAPRREPICLVVVAVAHVRVAVVHALGVRVGTAIGRGRPPVAAVTDIEGRTAVVVATGQGRKAIVIRVCDTRPRCPQGTYRLQFVACCTSTTHIGLQSIPRRGVGQVPARGASRQGGSVVVQASIGGTVACRIAVTPAIATGGGIVQVLSHPRLCTDHHGLIGLPITGICESSVAYRECA